jgi:GTP-binding protein EngB required for normal cell division
VTQPLARRFDALGRFARAVTTHLKPGLVDADVVAWAGRLSDRAGARLRLTGDHTVVALAGATGSGKSSLFNALAKLPLSEPGALRPTTAQTHACVWGGPNADALLDWLEVAHRFMRESALDGRDETPLHGLVLLDLPDVDSVAEAHRTEAQRLVGVVDLVIWVLDPQKYADQTVHEDYLRRLGALRDVTVVVFNQADRLTSDDVRRCLADLNRLVAADGLAGVPVLATSAYTGAGVPELRALVESAVAGRGVALARLAAELDQVVDQAAGLVRPVAPLPSDPLNAAVVGALIDELAVAAGVTTLAGLPVGSSNSSSGALPADPVAVAAAMRRLASRVSVGLPQPWPDQIETVLTARAELVPDELAAAVNRAVGAPPRRIRRLANRALGPLRRRRHRLAEERLRSAVATVARSAIAPARVVLRGYDEASVALWAAARTE